MDIEEDSIILNEDEKKLFRLTKNNTKVNRNITLKEKDYLKNAKSKYEEIYDEKVIKFCKNEEKNENSEKTDTKKVGRVKFSSIVEYSRN